MSELWRQAKEASDRFASQAAQYDRYRPSYPPELFTTILEAADLSDGDVVVEIGAATGIATLPLSDSGLTVHAVEPARELAQLTRMKLAGRASLVDGLFEDCPLPDSARLVAAFNAWHWVEPGIGLDRVARLLEPRGCLALVWTEVLSWGPPPFEERVAALFGEPWPKVMPHVRASLEPVDSDPRFGEIREFHHPFERTLDGASYVAVSQTYGGRRSAAQYDALQKMIAEEFDDAVIKKEDAVLYLSRLL